jgi:oligopeptide/dipeptide ABC transporter ATP-binding protein
MALLTVTGLGVTIGTVSPLDGVSFKARRGEILGLVGESGSGKSLTAMALMGLLGRIGGRVSAGSIQFDGQELTTLDEPAYRRLRGKRIAMISQNPMTSLDPLVQIGAQIDQVSRLHLGLSKPAAKARSIELMQQLRIPDAATLHGAYPHQLSGGMKQRIVIAMALAADPDLIIADEPTTALDVTIQAQIIQIMVDLVRERGLALILITHDMGVVAQACDRVVVLYAGRVAETDTTEALFAQPHHPYSASLIACIPAHDQAAGTLSGIPGTVPGVANYPAGCRFHPRCDRALAVCAEMAPPITALPTGSVACHLYGANA